MIKGHNYLFFVATPVFVEALICPILIKISLTLKPYSHITMKWCDERQMRFVMQRKEQ